MVVSLDHTIVICVVQALKSVCAAIEHSAGMLHSLTHCAIPPRGECHVAMATHTYMCRFVMTSDLLFSSSHKRWCREYHCHMYR